MKVDVITRHLVLFACACSGLTACETVSVTSSTGMPLPPPPVKAPSTPESAPVTNVVAISPFAMDQSSAGLDGEFPIAVYLYAQPYPSPKWESGSFVFKLYQSDKVPDEENSNEGVLVEKVWTSSEAWDVRNRSMVGNFYRFQVDLRESVVRNASNGRLGYRICFIPDSGNHRVYSSAKMIRVD